MLVKDFLKLEKGGAMIKVFDASKVGYRNTDKYVIHADRNVVVSTLADSEVVGFEPCGKNSIKLYVVID